MEDRIFESKDVDGKDVTLKFVRPSQVVLSKGDFVYRKHFSRAIRAGLMTNAEANKLLKDRDIWGDEQEQEVVDLRSAITELSEKLVGSKKDNGMTTFDRIKAVREELDDLLTVRSSVTENTAESVASEMRTQFFASECVVYKDSRKRVFKSLDDFLVRLDESATLDAYKEALIAGYENILGIKVPTNLNTTLPEDEWLVEVEPKVEKKTKKKRSRKKKTS